MAADASLTKEYKCKWRERYLPNLSALALKLWISLKKASLVVHSLSISNSVYVWEDLSTSFQSILYKKSFKSFQEQVVSKHILRFRSFPIFCNSGLFKFSGHATIWTTLQWVKFSVHDYFLKSFFVHLPFPFRFSFFKSLINLSLLWNCPIKVSSFLWGIIRILQ